MTLRLVLADDSILLREGIARLLVEAGFEVAAQVGTADELLAAVREHRPDVADRGHPDATDPHRRGSRAAEAIRAEHGTAVGILVLSQYVETTFAMRLVADGRAVSATCSRTASRTSTTSARPSDGSLAADR